MNKSQLVILTVVALVVAYGLSLFLSSEEEAPAPPPPAFSPPQDIDRGDTNRGSGDAVIPPPTPRPTMYPDTSSVEEEAAVSPVSTVSADPTPDFIDEDEDAQGAAEEQKDEAKEYSPFTKLSPIEKPKFNLLAQNVFERVPFDLIGYSPQLFKSGFKPLWEDWTDNKVQLIGNIDRVVLSFKHPDPPDAGEERLTDFELEVLFNEGRPKIDRVGPISGFGGGVKMVEGEKANLVIKHSSPRVPREIGGLRYKLKLKRDTRSIFRGSGQSSVVVMVPKSKIHGPRGLMLCPRDYNHWKVSGGHKVLSDIGFRLDSARFGGFFYVQGRVLTGFGEGFAEAVVQSTDNMAPSREISDSSKTLHPIASAEYKPVSGYTYPVPEDKTAITGGLRGQLRLHNSYNHRSVSSGVAKVTIREIPVQKDFSVTLNEETFRVQGGICYGIIKEIDYNHQFEKLAVEE